MNGGTLDLQGGGGVFESSNDQERRFQIDGGVANLGDFSVSRTTSGGGLLINDGTVTATSLRIGTAASRAYSDVYGGTLTVIGDFTVCDRNNGASSKDRAIRFFVRGGEVISTSADGIVVANQSNGEAADYSTIGGLLEVNDIGILTAEKITLVGSTSLSNAHARLNITGDSIVNLGSGGLVGNVGVENTSYSAELNGGTLVATAPLTIAADLTPGGGRLQTEDSGGSPQDVTLTGALVGSGTLVKTGSGSLILQGTSSHTGDIDIQEGTLSLQGDTIATTLNINVASGATFDVGVGYTLNDAQALSGDGTVSGDVSVASGASIQVSGVATIGALTFVNNLAESGGAANLFDVSSSTQDKIIVQGQLSLSGVNTIAVNTIGSVPTGAYMLIDYSTLSGDVGNLALSGVTGSLSNSVADGAIYLVLEVERPATNLVWAGDSVLNQWDNGTTSNWVNGATAFKFLPGDRVTFDDTGSTTPPVDLVGDLVPAEILVDASVDYTLAGSGKLTGLTGLTKTNSGTLTILTANDYVGVTTIGGGTLSVSNLADGGLPSAIGASAADAANLVLDGGTLEYLGGSLSLDRGITLGANGGTLSIADPAATLATTGLLTGEGLVTKQGEGQWDVSAANDYSGGTMVEAGVIRLVNDDGLGTNALTLNGVTDAATFQFNSDQQYLRNALYVYGTNNMLINSGNQYISGGLYGDGTLLLNFGAGKYLTPRTCDMSAFTGKIVLSDAGMNFRWYDAPYDASLTTFDLGSGTSQLGPRNGASDRIVRLGALMGGPGSVVKSFGSGLVEYEVGGKNLNTTFEGTVQDNGSAASLTKVGSGTLTLVGASTYTGDTTISEGTLALSSTASIYNSANIIIEQGAVLDASDLYTSAAGTFELYSGQILQGNGTVVGGFATGYGGTVAPGTSIGTLTATTNADLYTTTIMEVNRAASPNADKIVAPSIFLAGELVITNIGLNLQQGDEFDLFDGTITDGGYYITGPAGTTFDTSRLISEGIVTVATAPVPPQITNIVKESGAQVVASGSGGTPFGNYLVLASTDVSAPLVTWTPIQTNVFEADGSFSFTNAIDPNLPAEFLLIQGE